MEVVKDPSHSLVNILTAAALSKVALPLTKAIMGQLKLCGKTPSSLPSTSKKSQKNSILVPLLGMSTCTPTPSWVPGGLSGKQEGQTRAISCDPQDKRLDLFGRKVYSTGVLQLGISNQQDFAGQVRFHCLGLC